MELPNELKDLYRHWRRHTQKSIGSLAVADIFESPALFDAVSAFAHERIRIWEQKYLQHEPPFTTDPILSKYRFCNMLREFDRQTIEFHTLLNPLRDDFQLWLLNMFYCRMVARPETVRAIGLVSFDENKNGALRKRLQDHSRPKYGTPYVFPVSVIMRSSTPTREAFITEYLPSIMQKVAEVIASWDSVSVTDGVRQIVPVFGFNLNFLWTEVLIDVAYQYPDRIDLFKEFPVGPGSLPTMQRINPNIPPEQLAERLGKLDIPTGITYDGKQIVLSAENWEGVGCEFRKYTNLKEGKGRRRLYSAS